VYLLETQIVISSSIAPVFVQKKDSSLDSTSSCISILVLFVKRMVGCWTPSHLKMEGMALLVVVDLNFRVPILMGGLFDSVTGTGERDDSPDKVRIKGVVLGRGKRLR